LKWSWWLPITLQQLRNFVAVVEAGSFRAAADRLNGQQSAISRSIQELESCLGAELFARLPSGSKLTDIGEHLFPSIISIIGSIDELATKAHARKAPRSGGLALGVDETLAPVHIQQVLSNVRDMNSNLLITLMQCSAQEVISNVKSGRIQFGIVSDRELPAGLSFRRLLVGQLLAIFPNDWRIDGDLLDVALLKDRSLHIASTDIATGDISRLRQFFGPQAKITSHDCGPGGLVSIIASGMGVGLITHAPLEAATMPLKVLPIDPAIPAVVLTAVWLPDTALPDVIGLLDHLASRRWARLPRHDPDRDNGVAVGSEDGS
jgi:DNA-binding transcriptional LysR family regulator